MGRLHSNGRCPNCGIRRALCFCSFIPRFELQTRVVILMHVAEETLTTNTARLAAKALSNCELRCRGRKTAPLEVSSFAAADRLPLVLYPSVHAAELNAAFVARLDRPVTLIVPDGSWAQTRRTVRREPALAGIPQVKLPTGAPSEYRLRVQPPSGSLCTLEAIARAIGILESVAVERELEHLLRVMVERTLWSRGVIAASDCTAAGIPAAAFASDLPQQRQVRGGVLESNH